MKMKTLEKYLLLEQSGELSARQRRQLDACPEAQAKRDELNVLCAATPTAAVEPSPWTTTKIAARLREDQRPAFTFSKVWKPVFLTAACLMLVVNTFDFKQTPSSSAVVATTVEVNVRYDQLEEDLVELESLILAMSGDSLDIMEM